MAQMVELTSRCLALAEGVVTMVCPVLLALAIKKINWKGKVEDSVVPMVMLLIASVTLITGIYPLLACCVSKLFPNMPRRCPHVTSSVAAHLSSICLILLAGFISFLILPLNDMAVIGGGGVAGIVVIDILVLSILHSRAEAPSDTAEREANEGTKEVHYILDKTHEFMSGVTGILFLGLEALTLEGLISTCHVVPDAFQIPAIISLLLCASGVSLMLVTMIYPLTVETEKANIVHMTFVFDLFMTVGTVAILTLIMEKLMGPIGLLLFTSPLLIFFEVVYRLATSQFPVTDVESASSSPPPSPRAQQNETKAAPLGLIKVTFAGFWAMSVTTIGTDSPNHCFLIFAAAGIASGLVWRLLTHSKVKVMVETANTASFWTHLWIAVATVLFTVMAWEAAANKLQVNTCARRQ